LTKGQGLTIEIRDIVKVMIPVRRLPAAASGDQDIGFYEIFTPQGRNFTTF
jgi:hypothetical protein